MSRVDVFLELVIKQGGSDLHLVSGNPPRIRLHGEAFTVKYRELTNKETSELLYEIMPIGVKNLFEKEGGADFAYAVENLARFRVNIFKHLGGIGAVFRAIPNEIQTLSGLKLSPVLKNLCQQQKGLILVTGPTGSGKSTTLSAMLDFINSNKNGHIITIEDPIEFIHTNKKCLISQREIGAHTARFSDALRSSLREDPDVILIGEMRDLETIHLALTAAETGILVIATLHTSGAASTIDRIINVFPAGEEPYVRTMLSTSLVAVISQQLIRTADQKSRAAALEIMINNSAVSNIIREGKTDQLDNVIQSGAVQGMQRMDTAIRRLLDANIITAEEAYLKSRNKAEFSEFSNAEEIIGNDQSSISNNSASTTGNTINV